MNFIFDPSLVLYLPLHEKDGSSFMSGDACGHLCTVTGALWRPDGRYFDGTDDYISVAYSPALYPETPPLMEIWLKTSTAVQKGIIGNYDDNGGYFTMVTGGGKVYIGYRCGTSYAILSSVGSINDGRSHHIVSFYDNVDTIYIYIDGELDTSGKDSGDGGAYTPHPNRNVDIGRRNAGENILATIGEVRIYNRHLNPLEIQHNNLATKWRYR